LTDAFLADFLAGLLAFFAPFLAGLLAGFLATLGTLGAATFFAAARAKVKGLVSD